MKKILGLIAVVVLGAACESTPNTGDVELTSTNRANAGSSTSPPPALGYRLKTGTGDLLPGRILGAGISLFFTLWNEQEGTVAAYGFNAPERVSDGYGGWGLAQMRTYFQSSYCDGDGYVNFEPLSTNGKQVFANGDTRFILSDETIPQETWMSSQRNATTSACENLDSRARRPWRKIIPYDGSFPLLAEGPYTIITAE